MFLIAKIVRGRRLLHELEQQEKDEAAAALEAAHSLSQVSRRLANRHRHSSALENTEDNQAFTNSNRSRRRKTVRQKTDGCGSVDSSLGTPEKVQIRRTSSMPSLCENTQASSSVKHYIYEGKLNKMQRRALRFTWHRLQTRNGGKRVENVFEEVFDRLVRILPQIKDMFTTRMFLCAMSRNEMANLRDHAKVTVKMIDLVIKNLDVERSKRTDTGSSEDPRIIGQAHGPLRPYGMTGQYWEKFGETVIDVVLAQEAVRDLPGAGQAWVIFTACLVDQLRAGFDENRSLHPIFSKQSAVLHHATKHLHGQETPEPNISESLLSTNQPTCSQNNDSGTSYITHHIQQLPFTPKIFKQQSLPEEERTRKNDGGKEDLSVGNSEFVEGRERTINT